MTELHHEREVAIGGLIRHRYRSYSAISGPSERSAHNAIVKAYSRRTSDDGQLRLAQMVL